MTTTKLEVFCRCGHDKDRHNIEEKYCRGCIANCKKFRPSVELSAVLAAIDDEIKEQAKVLEIIKDKGMRGEVLATIDLLERLKRKLGV